MFDKSTNISKGFDVRIFLYVRRNSDNNFHRSLEMIICVVSFIVPNIIPSF